MKGIDSPPTPLICLGLNISFSFTALPHIENLREFWIQILTKSPIYSRLSQDKKTFLAVQLTKRLLHDCVLHRTTYDMSYFLRVWEMDVLTYRSEKSKKVEKLNPKILHCKSFDAVLALIHCCLLLFLFGRTDAGKQKSSISNSSILQCSLIQLFTN